MAAAYITYVLYLSVQGRDLEDARYVGSHLLSEVARGDQHIDRGSSLTGPLR